MSSKPVLMVSFSGGRTSAYMSWWLKMTLSHVYELVFVFMNTGQEEEETLIFVNQCDKRWGLGVVWIEAVVNTELGKGTDYKVVDFHSAHRGGDIFRAVARKYGLFNKKWTHCNREMKLKPFERYRKDHHPGSWRALGIRVDEIDRISPNAEKAKVMYPLFNMNPMTKPEIIKWWSMQSFDLKLPEHLGNCITCWKKSDRKLYTVWHETPEVFDLFLNLETDPDVIAATEARPKNPGFIYRGYRSTADLIRDAQGSFKMYRDPNFNQEDDTSNGCSESCSPYTPEQIDMLLIEEDEGEAA